jgi:hypothetical protein
MAIGVWYGVTMCEVVVEIAGSKGMLWSVCCHIVSLW